MDRRLLACGLPFAPGAAHARKAPQTAGPMVFDLVRPLGARHGELEVNALAQRDMSGSNRTVEWAPEIAPWRPRAGMRLARKL